jgi:hypothetical protein
MNGSVTIVTPLVRMHYRDTCLWIGVLVLYGILGELGWVGTLFSSLDYNP